ncbi:MAG: hypothetical protein ACFHXK_16490 [bacterium]
MLKKPCQALSILIFASLLTPVVSASDARGLYQYDAKMAWLKAGELSLEMFRSGTTYEVLGEFQTSRAMSNYYTWNGVFAASGRWEHAGPVTRAYMSRSVSKDDDLKIVLNYENSARLLDGPDSDFEDIAKPTGVDLISALFFTPDCFAGGEVHDGEDTYRLALRERKTLDWNGGEGYYQGPVTHCDYNIRDHKDRKRRVVVSLAQVGDAIIAVQVRAKIPVLPDAVFRLRVPGSDAGLSAPVVAVGMR